MGLDPGGRRADAAVYRLLVGIFRLVNSLLIGVGGHPLAGKGDGPLWRSPGRPDRRIENPTRAGEIKGVADVEHDEPTALAEDRDQRAASTGYPACVTNTLKQLSVRPHLRLTRMYRRTLKFR